jgi:plasmid maintenance system killer protein
LLRIIPPGDACASELLAKLRLTYRVTCTTVSYDRQLSGQAHKRFAAGKTVRAFSGFERSARLKLDRLEAATSVKDLSALPGNRFEALKAAGRVNTAFGSTINGAFALSGQLARKARRTWKLSITTERRK